MSRTAAGTAGHLPDDRARYPSLILHVVGLSIAVSGIGVLISGVVEAIDSGAEVVSLLLCGAAITSVGIALRWSTRLPANIQALEIFSTVAMAWVALAVVGALPYIVTGTITSFDDAIFESVSGFTTTGATVLRPIEGISKGVLFWRATTQWLGGMGVIVLVVAVLPAAGAGGFDLLEAEAPGPAGERLTPRVQQTAARLWMVYVGFTVLLTGLYMAGGMSIYDGVSHSFTTVSTGGFSPYNRSLGHFDSSYIEWVAIAAMFAAGTSFTLIYRTVTGKVGPLLRSIEFRLYVVVVAAASVCVYLTADPTVTGHQAMRDALFAVTSVTSTTGYATADFGAWEQSAQSVLLLLMPLGAMAGSTAGGVKMVRLLAVASFAHRETLRQLHPRMVRPVRVGGEILDDRIVKKVLGFLVLSLALFGGSALLMALSGADMVTALSAAATTFGNVGPGLADIGPTNDFLNLPRFARWVAIGNMALGRLEIYPILLALASIPQPWRRWWRRLTA
ncbi:MAG: trk system potassium uptake protein TrkH [Acidimicrobiales bacterium]